MNRNACWNVVQVLAILLVGVGPLSGDTFGLFTYTNNATTITITGYPTTAVGPVEIPASIVGKPVTSIGTYAFASCSNLTSVAIPIGVTNIGSNAFQYCSNLTSVAIPIGVTSIGSNVYQYCSSVTSVTIPNSVITIGNQAFLGCGLTSITIPTSVTSMGQQAFQACGRLTSVTIPDSVGMTSIGYQAFQSCISLTSVTIPNSVTSIATDAFGYCTSLTRIKIPTSVTSIGDMVFRHCTSLMSVTIPASVTDIGSSVFYSCNSLVSINFIGNAPSLISGFNLLNGTIYYFNDSSGFDEPYWMGHPAVNMGDFTPVASWLLTNGFAYNTDLQEDPNYDGVNLLMAYALNLDPYRNPSGNMPSPVLAANQISLTFYAGSEGVTYVVESSSDLRNWSTAGVTLSAPDSNKFRTATAAITGGHRFMRLMVEH